MSLGMDRYKYAAFTVAGTVTCSDGTPCVLHCLNITNTTAGTITVTEGTAAAAATIGVWLGGTMNSFRLDAELTGLQIVTDANIHGNVTYTLI
jgi:hypothetical protein